ncbi:MAG: GTPase HflX [Pseudomonadota bacterium]
MLFERPKAGRRALILHVELERKDNPDPDEFRELARSAELEVVDVVSAPRRAPHPRYFVGTGKVDEIRMLLKARRADLLLVNHEVSPGQQRNLEQSLDCQTISRTELILTIFAARARSHEGQLQVELAQLKHAQTRLVRGWTHLDRQKGGIGLRGAGEKQIELDQRMLGDRIKVHENKLVEVSKRRAQNRRGRDRRGTPTVALVGYTNAGKSTLFNALTNAAVYAEDQLFATLDPTMRRVAIAGLNEVVLADTVGFVSLLPHALVEAFKATLEEVVYADLLLHVVDGADPLVLDRVHQVRDVLKEIGVANVAEILVINKQDLLESNRLEQVKIDLITELGQDVVDVCAISAMQGKGLDDLEASIGEQLGVVAPHEVMLDPTDGKTRAWLYQSGAVLSEITTEDGHLQLTLQADDYVINRLRNNPGVSLRESATVPKISI